MSLAIGPGCCYMPLPSSGVQAAEGVWNILFDRYIICFILPSVHLSSLNSKVVSLPFHAAFPCCGASPALQEQITGPTESHVHHKTSCFSCHLET